MKKQKQKLAIHKVWNQHRFTSLLFLFAVFVFALGNMLYQSVTDRVSENEVLAAVGDLHIYNCESLGIVGDHPNVAIPLCARVAKEGTYPAEAKDVDVNWAITSRETSSSAVATLAGTVSKTNQSGLASNSLISNTTGTYFVKASLVSGEFVTIKVLVTGQFGEYTIDQYGLGSGDNQIGTVSTPLAGNFVVQVSGVPGSTGQVGSLTITWRVASYPAGATGYSISPHTVVDEYGVSRNKLTLGNLPGTYTVEASKDGVWGSPVTFSAVAYSGGGTTTTNPVYSGDPVVQGLTVTNRTATKATISWKEVFRGDADSSHRVEFADFGALGNKYGAKRGDAKYTEPADCNSNGTVDFADYGLVGSHYNTTITGYKINSPVGTYSTFFSYLTSIGSASDWKIWEAEVSVASTAGTISVFPEGAGFNGSNFGASVAVPAFMAPDNFSISLAPTNNGNNQTGLVSTDLANDFVVIVKNNGTPVAGKVVNWTMTQGPSATTGQAMNPASSTSASTGLASSRFHLGSVKGSYIVTARLADEINKTVQFTVTADEFVVIKTAGDGQEGGVGSRLTNQLQIIVRVGNQPVSGQAV
jgi:hypothetical protein